MYTLSTYICSTDKYTYIESLRKRERNIYIYTYILRYASWWTWTRTHINIMENLTASWTCGMRNLSWRDWWNSLWCCPGYTLHTYTQSSSSRTNTHADTQGLEQIELPSWVLIGYQYFVWSNESNSNHALVGAYICHHTRTNTQTRRRTWKRQQPWARWETPWT